MCPQVQVVKFMESHFLFRRWVQCQGEVFNKSVGFRVGEGKNIHFWYDDWVAIGKFWPLFPRLFRVVCNKESSVKDCYFWVSSKVSWFVSFSRGFCQFEVSDYESLLSILVNVFICKGEEHIRIWKPCPLGRISIGSFYGVSSIVLGSHSHLSQVWCGLAPPRVEVFLWLAVAEKISTVDNLRKRRIMSEAISDTCVLCGKEKETITHLFLHCEFASCIWQSFFKKCGISWCLPRALSELMEAWRSGPFKGVGLILWRLIPFSILWSIWKERNNRIFNGKSKDREDIVFMIVLKIAKWASIKKELEHLTLDNNLSNWEACLGSRCVKKKHLVTWSPPLLIRELPRSQSAVRSNFKTF